MKTLYLACDETDSPPVYLNWTVADDTPDMVYYQVRSNQTSTLTLNQLVSSTVLHPPQPGLEDPRGEPGHDRQVQRVAWFVRREFAQYSSVGGGRRHESAYGRLRPAPVLIVTTVHFGKVPSLELGSASANANGGGGGGVGLVA